ncbi:MAG: methyltransferase domain-containing protein [Ignavibacteria bacterium]|nr:methyltransferase domain-containing protein [Ignavibacteria bacterium]
MKEKWNERFSSEEYVYGKNPNKFLEETFINKKDLFKSPVLLLGDGEGRNGVFLAQNNLDVTSLDFSEFAVEKIKRLAKEKNVKINLILSDALEFNFVENFWGTIISIFFHLESKDRKIIHDKIKFSLKSGGLFLLEAFSPRQLNFTSGGPKDVDLLYTSDELNKDFSSFEIMKCEEVETELDEGLLHQGKASVVRFIGRKL